MLCQILTINFRAMKSISSISVLLTLTIVLCSTPTLFSQTSDSKKELKEDKIWSVEYIRTKPGQGEKYEKYLAKNYVSLMNKAKERGIIADYILLSSMPANGEDWDIMIMVAVNKFADMDNMDEKFEKLITEVFDPKDEARQKELEDRYNLRVFMGGKMARQLVLK